MTNTAMSHRTHSSRLRSIQADLVFWTAAGAVVAALSGPLSASWGVSGAVLLDVGLAFVVLGPAMLLGLSRMRITRGLVAAFVVTNAALALLAWVTAVFGWLPLTGAGTRALADAGVVMFALGLWQFTAMRASSD